MLRLGRTIKPEANEAKCGYEPFSHLAETTKGQTFSKWPMKYLKREGGLHLRIDVASFKNLSVGGSSINPQAKQLSGLLAEFN